MAFSECCGCATATNFSNYQQEDGCVGPPQPWNEIRLDPIAPNQDLGEIWIRGDNVVSGYLNGETQDDQGWLRTG